MEEVKLNDILMIPKDEIRNYKLHLAANSDDAEPLDVFLRDFKEWVGWNAWRNNRDDFSRPYIFSLIPDYNRPGKYIFGGIFEIIERCPDYKNTHVGYKLDLSEKYKGLIGRLVVNFNRYQGMRGRAFRFENYIDQMSLCEITEKKYSGEPFPGYENVLLSFPSLEQLVRSNKLDWKTALESWKGIYVIVDKSNGKKYVGSAYGDYGIWSRWSCYVNTGGHGGNDELVDLIKANGIEYARKNFQYSILELLPMKTDDETVIRRESFWKEVLLTRGSFGYNKN